MKVSFFHLGAAYAYIEPYLRSLGLDVVVPPFSSRRTLDLGTRFCPEMICVPCKLIFGNYVEALEAGAEALIMFGGPGTCRLGYSARQQERLLRQWGHSFTAHTFDLYHAHSELIRLTRELADPSLPRLVEALRFLFALITLSDQVEQATLHLRPCEWERGIATRLRSQALSQIASLSSRQELEEQRQAILSPFEETLNTPVTVPPHYDVMGAIGAALLAHEYVEINGDRPTRFKGWEVTETEYDTSSFECKGCPNLCEVVQIKVGREVLARWGGRCGKWEM